MNATNHSILNPETREPFHVQLARILREELQGMTAGDRFYCDKELCRKYSVSLTVVRTAMMELVREGRICRIRSKGTFVARHKARPRRSRRTRIGIVIPLNVVYLPHIASVRGMRQILDERNSELILVEHPCPPLADPERILDIAQPQLAKMDGLVWVSACMERLSRSLPALRQIAERMVFINLYLPDNALSCVCADYEGAAFALTEHLIGRGFKRIGFIGGPAGRLAAELRLKGFQRAMMAHGLQMDPEYVCPNTDGMDYEAGKKEIARMLASGHLPEAIFAVTDTMARGVIMELGAAKLQVPEDIAVVGFDDAPMAVEIPPPLTTARIPYHELGRKAAIPSEVK